MQLIKLDATDSTNDYLKSLMTSDRLSDCTVVVAEHQLKGRGQMGAKWQSEPGKNLTFSILKNTLDLPATYAFMLNVYVSIAIYSSLQTLSVPDLTIKWPNDILSGTSKICGILIENVLSGDRIDSAVIGIGLNVNQLHFDALLNVSSLKLLLGRTFNLEELLNLVINNLERVFQDANDNETAAYWKVYESVLFRKDKPSTFKDATGQLFMGFIRGVSQEGKLVIELEDKVIKNFDLKEVKLLY